MNYIKVESRKDGIKADAKELENGRFEIFIPGGETKEVAASTFKRWYKVLKEPKQTPIQRIPGGRATKTDPEYKRKAVEEFNKRKKEKMPNPANPNSKQTPITRGKDATPAKPKHKTVAEETVAEVDKMIKEVDKTLKGKSEEINSDEVSYEDEEAVPTVKLKPVKMIGRKEGTVNSKQEKRTKYFDTFEFSGYILEITYSHVWSVDVKLLTTEGKLVYKSPTGALAPMFDHLGLSKEAKNEVRKQIRNERKQWGN